MSSTPHTFFLQVMIELSIYNLLVIAGHMTKQMQTAGLYNTAVIQCLTIV